MAAIVKRAKTKILASKGNKGILGRKPKAAKPISAKRKFVGVKVLLRKGETVKVVTLRGALGVSQAELARLTGYSVRAIAGWESGKPLSEPARQKLTETERLRAALSELLPPAEVGAWMRASNPSFEGQTPLQVIERGESDRLWQMIFEIDANVAN